MRRDNVDGIEQQLEYISNSIDNVSSGIDVLSQNCNNNGSFGGIGFIIVIILLCINNNIKKLTQAIRDKNSKL